MKRWICIIIAVSILFTVGLPEHMVSASAECGGYLVGISEMRLQSAQELDISMTYVRENLYCVGSASDVAAMQAAGLVEYYEPNYPIYLMDARWNMQAVNAPAVWNHQNSQGTYDRRGSGVTVAVIDSGVNAEHPDFKAENILPYYDTFDNKNGIDIWHGTFVAGLIAAQVENGIGIDGAASDVNILPICITKDGKSDTMSAIRAIDYAVAHGADVINLSIGGSKSTRALEQACKDAVAAGVILVAAAGNYQEGDTPSAKKYMYPAGYKNVIGVSGCKKIDSGEIEFDDTYSYYNDQVNVCAPGTKISSLYLDSGTASASGTSFAAPIVSAMAAIAKQCNAAIDFDAFLALLKATSTDLGAEGDDIYYGAGLVNMEAFCAQLEAVYPIHYYSGDTEAAFADAVPRTYTIADADIILPQPVRTGYSFLGWYDNAALRGKPVTVLPTASMGERSFYAAWEKLPNAAPTITAAAETVGTAVPASLDGITPAVNYHAEIASWFADPEGDALTYRLIGDTGTLDGSVLSYTPTTADAGKEILLRLQAEDERGAQTPIHTVSIHVGAVPNSAPTIDTDFSTEVTASPPSADGLTSAVPLCADVRHWFEDLDGDSLTYRLLDGVGTLEGTILTYIPTVQDSGKTFLLHLQAKDAAGADSPILTLTLSVSARVNSVPAITACAPNEITVVPASLDGKTPAVIYCADVGEWFTDADGDALQYCLFGDIGSLEGTVLTIAPDAKDANTDRTLSIQAVDTSNATSPVLTVPVHIHALPTSQSILNRQDVTLNLCDLPTEIALPLVLYGNQVTAVTLDDNTLSWRLEEEMLIVHIPDNLSLGESTLSIAFDAGKTVTCLWKTIRDCPSADFEDISFDAWYHSAVDFAVRNGLMQGVGGGCFAPDRTLTRAMLVTILYRMAGQPRISQAAPFTDVAEDCWYANAVAWAASKGIVQGIGNGAFAPNDAVTREQLVTILFRYATDDGIRAEFSGFPDADHISSYAMEPMAWAIGHGIVSGIASSGTVTLSPQGTATRAQIAAILMRFLTMNSL